MLAACYCPFPLQPPLYRNLQQEAGFLLAHHATGSGGAALEEMLAAGVGATCLACLTSASERHIALGETRAKQRRLPALMILLRLSDFQLNALCAVAWPVLT